MLLIVSEIIITLFQSAVIQWRFEDVKLQQLTAKVWVKMSKFLHLKV